MADDVAAAASNAKGTAWADSDAWERHRNVISQLYGSQNRTLKQVIEIMERDHDFHATPKMYKHRFKRWGLAKYSTREPLRVQKKTYPHYPDVSQSALTVRGKGSNDGLPYKKGSKQKGQDQSAVPFSNEVVPFHSAGHVTSMPANNDAFIPRLYVNVTSPFFQQENTYYAIKGYYDTSFSALSTWTQSSTETGQLQIKPSVALIRDQLQGLHSRFRIALNKLASQPLDPADLAEGIKIMRVCFAQLPDVLAAEDPILIVHILDIVRRLQESGQGFIEAQLRRHVAWLANTPSQPHSTTLLSRILSTGFPLDRYHRSLLTQIAVDAFQNHLGPWHFETLQLAMWLLFNREEDRFLRSSGVRQIYAGLEAGEGKDVFDNRHLDILMNLSSHHYRSDEPAETVKIVNSVLLDPARLKELQKYPEIGYNFYWLAGKALGKQGKHVEAEGYIHTALSVAKELQEKDPTDDVCYLSGMTALELNLRDQGRPEDANSVLEMRQAYIRASLENVGELDSTTLLAGIHILENPSSQHRWER